MYTAEADILILLQLSNWIEFETRVGISPEDGKWRVQVVTSQVTKSFSRITFVTRALTTRYTSVAFKLCI